VSVAGNGSSNTVPSRFHTATQYLDFPGDFGDSKIFRLEGATLPSFSDLSQNVSGALNYALDSNTRLNVFAGIIMTEDIVRLPILRGTTQDRINNPGLRPANPCTGCGLVDAVYQGNIGFMRKYSGHLPRLDIGSRPIPMEASAGVTTKYYYEELWDGEYEAQNLNLDFGASLKLSWGYDPISRASDRDLKFQISGFEILPTKQRGAVGGFEVSERLESRWRVTFSWEEGLPSLGSFLTLAATQRSEGGKWPGLGAEWDLRRQLFVRAGWDGEFLSAGASVAWKMLSVHYAFRHHELGTSLYQVSAQVEWP
jgi:hypothetical protein